MGDSSALTPLTRAEVPVADVHGDGLRLTLADTNDPAVAERVVVVPQSGVAIRLEVLAASHRVTVLGVADGAPLLTETVACVTDTTTAVPVLPDRLPERFERRAAGSTYLFESYTTAGTDRSAGLVRSIATSSDALVVEFPGHPDALTGIRMHDSDDRNLLSWQTWHLYPGDNAHVVSTASTLRLPQGPA